MPISIKKTKVTGQNVPTPPSISINNEVLEVTDHFTYLGSTVTSNLSLDKEIDKRIAKAAAVLSKLSKRVWNISQLTLNTKLKVYQACVLSTLLYGSESWTTYAQQENRLESFHLRCLRRIMGITWHHRRCVGKSKLPWHASHALQTSTTLARTRASNGERSYTQGSPVW